MNNNKICSTDDELSTDDEFEYVETEQLDDIVQTSQRHFLDLEIMQNQ